MKRFIFLVPLLLITIDVYSQFEQKIGLNFSTGVFKTFGKKLGEYEPMQMPNYKIGFSANAGMQFRISERFFISAELGIMITQNWNYSTGNNNNYMYWSFLDSVSGNTIEGEDYLDLHNYSIGVKPKFYLAHAKKWTPYIYTGITVNITLAWYENSLWATQNEYNMLPPDDTGPYNGNLERNFGIGLNPGFGMEYSPSDKIHIYLEPGCYFIKLNKKNFKEPSRVENFKAFQLHLGLRYNFIKSKEL
jgi:hypothetical protein